MPDIYYTITVIFAFLILNIINRGINSTKFEGKQGVTEYQWFVRSIELFLLVDATWGIVQGLHGRIYAYLDALAYNVTMVFTVLMCCRYVSKFLELHNKSGKILNIFGVGFFAMDIIMIIVNFFIPVVFWIDEAGDYHTGLARHIGMIILAAVFVIMALTALVASIGAKGIVKDKIISLFLFASFITAALVVQTIFPLFPCFSLGFVTGVIILFVQVHVVEQHEQLTEITNLNHSLEERQEQIERSSQELVKLKKMIDASNIGVWELVTNKRCNQRLRTDRKMKEIMGIPPDSDITEEDANEMLQLRIYPDDLPSFKEYDVKLKRGERAECTYRWNHPVLGLRYMRCGGIMLSKYSNGDVVCTGYHSDVTDQVRMEKELQMNIAASKAKTKFLQNMSHEIRTPLNAIYGFAQLLGLPDGSCTEEEKESYNHIINNSYLMLDMLINDILDSADIQNGNYSMNISECNVNEIGRNAIMCVEYRCPANVELKFTSDVDDDYMMTSDPRRIQQVLVNFLTNACKNTAQGEIHLHISNNEIPHAITFSVTDTGKGVPAENAESIFGRYTKLDKNIEGSGLGLNICHTISTRLGGRAYVDTTYNHGARFVLELKRYYVKPEQTEQTEN